MAIKNTNLGGTDWAFEESPVAAADLNDTFDAAVVALRTNPAFWLNSDTYDVYDDFNSYSINVLKSVKTIVPNELVYKKNITSSDLFFHTFRTAWEKAIYNEPPDICQRI